MIDTWEYALQDLDATVANVPDRRLVDLTLHVVAVPLAAAVAVACERAAGVTCLQPVAAEALKWTRHEGRAPAGLNDVLPTWDLREQQTIRTEDAGALVITSAEQFHFRNIHALNDCLGRPCVVHSPTEHGMSTWPLVWRDDRGVFERICVHGCGHPDPDQFEYWREIGQPSLATHGCCGCCGGVPSQ